MAEHKFLQKSRHGTWCFRIRVPRHCQAILGRRELRRSLSTGDLKTARVEARILSGYASKLFSALRHKKIITPLTNEESDFMSRDFMGFNIQIPTPNGPLTIKSDPNNPNDAKEAQEALRIVLASGVLGPASSTQQTASTTPSSRLSDVAERLKQRKAQRSISPSTLSEYLAVIQEFITWKGDVQIRTVTSRDIGDFSHYLLEERNPRITPRTLDKKLNALNAMFAQAALDGDWNKKDDYPTVGHFRFKKKRRAHAASVDTGYRAFSADELEKLFDPQHFLKNAKAPHDYWLPILGLLTGGRLNELAQLMVADVKQHNGVWVLHITDEDHPQKRVKTDSGRRMIPLHPKLIDLGFLDYVTYVGQTDFSGLPASGLIFPYLTYSEKNGFGGAPSKRFGRYVDRLGFKDPQLVFHSLRKNFNQDLIDRQVHVEHRSRLMGQAFDSVNSEVYGTDLPLDQVLRDFIEPNAAIAISVKALKLDLGSFGDQLSKLLHKQIKEQERQRRLADRDTPYFARKRLRISTA